MQHPEPARVPLPTMRPLPSHSELAAALDSAPRSVILACEIAPQAQHSWYGRHVRQMREPRSVPGLLAPVGLIQPFRPPPGLEPPAIVSPTAFSLSLTLTTSTKVPFECGAACSSSWETASTADPAEDILSQHECPPEPTTLVLNLCDAIAGRIAFQCTAACPSLGSAGHHLGTCRPCDFAARGADCRAGMACQFCHLCGPEERKQHKAQRRKPLRTTGN